MNENNGCVPDWCDTFPQTLGSKYDSFEILELNNEYHIKDKMTSNATTIYEVINVYKFKIDNYCNGFRLKFRALHGYATFNLYYYNDDLVR